MESLIIVILVMLVMIVIIIIIIIMMIAVIIMITIVIRVIEITPTLDQSTPSVNKVPGPRKLINQNFEIPGYINKHTHTQKQYNLESSWG